MRQKKSIFGKTEKICKFCQENQDLQFFKAKKKSEKFLHSYLLCEIKEILSNGDRKRNIIFKGNPKNKVQSSLKLEMILKIFVFLLVIFLNSEKKEPFKSKIR